MNSSPQLSNDLLSVEALERLDRVCVECEAAWKAGRRPQIEDYIDGWNGAERRWLLSDLLKLELEYARCNDLRLCASEYHKRFPQETSVVDAVISEVRVSADSKSGEFAETANAVCRRAEQECELVKRPPR